METHKFKKGKQIEDRTEVVPLMYFACKLCEKSAQDHAGFFEEIRKITKRIQKQNEKYSVTPRLWSRAELKEFIKEVLADI